MEWCLDCHRAPEKYLRPREAVFTVDYQPPADQLALGGQLAKDYQVRRLTSCSTCHR
jgi:mono/diheme cytochrome c family protein